MTGVQRWRGRLLLLLLGGFFAAPFAGAWMVYVHSALQPQDRVNHGELMQPAAPLRLDGVGQRWVLLFVMPASCPSECRQWLDRLQRVQRALGDDYGRVQRVVVSARSIEPGLAGDLQQGGWRIQNTTAGSEFGAVAGTTLLVDPHGNPVLRYTDRHDPMALLTDLRRLLRWSRIG